MFTNPNRGLLIAFIKNSFPHLGKNIKKTYESYDLPKYDINLLTDVLFEICRVLSVDQLKEIKDDSGVSSLYNWYRERLSNNPEFFRAEYDRICPKSDYMNESEPPSLR